MKSHGDFLFEIGCEEIPTEMISKASEELKVILHKYFTTHRLLEEASTADSVQAFGGARRLTAIVREVRLRQPDTTREVTGPPRSVAYDSVGEPTRAAMSFAEKQGIPVSKLRIVNTPRGDQVAATQLIKGKPAREILTEVLPQIIQEIPWPRAMYWNHLHDPRFIRPIRWIVAVLGDQAIPLSFAGVRAGNHTCGHRFLGKKNITVAGPRDYEVKLKKNFILCRPDARREKVASELHRLANQKGLRVQEDSGLLETVAYLNEYPTAILGDFDPAFLDLPEEILITVMRDHQKYFALRNRSGQLAPHFLAVINLARDPKGWVRSGHERVLRARFADAQFFWQADQKCRLADFLPKLAHVTFESRLGNYRDKVERIRTIARWLAEQWFSGGVALADVAGSDRAAELAKCDLVTEMVREFTELQGIVGGLYAHAQGEPEEISCAVYDHYRPLGLDDPIPRNLSGCAVALADKLDSLVACFAVGAVPTGSSDPFALRRAALGIVKIILERNLPLSLTAAISAAAKSLKEHAPRLEAPDPAQKQVLEFLLDRARFVLRERRGFAYDEINAAFGAGADDLVDAVERVAAVKAIRHARNFVPLALAFKRIRNILEKSAGAADKGQGAVRPELLREPAERELFKAAQKIGAEALRHKKAKRYREALEIISELRSAVDPFFDKVLVMVEEEEIRRNRIALLGSLLREFSTIADFSELAGEENKATARAAARG